VAKPSAPSNCSDCFAASVFPQKNILKTLLLFLAYLITSIGFIQKKMISNMPVFMIRPYKNLFAGVGK